MSQPRGRLIIFAAIAPLLLTGLSLTAQAATRADPDTTIDSQKTTSGVQIGGKQKKLGRLEIDNKTPKKTATKTSDASTPRRPFPLTTHPTETVSKQRKTRLNIGLCGREQPDGTIPGPTRCQPYVPDRPDQRKPTTTQTPRPPRPQDVTWEQIASETKDVSFPALTVQVQPRGRTLVNLDTIVYTDNNGVTANWVSVLGFPVLVEATPQRFKWNFGDGTTMTTTSPGRPYPSKDITHKYMKRATVGLTVTVEYTARFFVSGAGWRNVDGVVSITGPVTTLQVREAVPVLVDPGR
ncbi:PKD domain-containing protein [Kribbella sp. NPDC004875]|uniref:PKD domain-containing protein n=1 Tax=Kribbella sp. NPDC004875 TaxID=3364107 RepID=UPI0036C92E5E